MNAGAERAAGESKQSRAAALERAVGGSEAGAMKAVYQQARRRLEDLEKDRIGVPATLTMPDGSTVIIPGESNYLLDLLGAVSGGRVLSAAQQKHIDLICRCADSHEPGEAHIINLIRVFLAGPVERQSPLSRPQPHANKV
jgi:hypothetical protein